MKILSGVLSLGNVNFGAKAEEDKVSVTYPDDLEIAAELFGIQWDELAECLTSRQMNTRGEEIVYNFNKQEANGQTQRLIQILQ